MKPGTKIALGILTAVSVMVFIVVYDVFIKDKIDSVEVVVVKAGTNIKKSEILTEENILIEGRSKQDLIGDVVLAKDIDEVLGYEAAQDMISNSMVSKKMIDYDQIVPDESKGEAIRPIISDMIFAKPGSLRRKDSIDIYLINKDVIEKYMGTQKDISVPSTVVSSDQAQKIQGMLSEPILKNVKVVYAKDSSNREVTNAKEEEKVKKESERLNATGNITDIEVILNEEEFHNLMKEVMQNGNKLYITYN